MANLAELQKRAAAPAQPIETGFGSVEGFAALQRMASLFTHSSIVPDTFRGDANFGNACIALEMALRMKANPLMVMQSIYIVHGRPAWSAQFLIATLNQCGKFSALRYVFQGQPGQDDWGCKAYATEMSTGEKLEGPLITISLAKREGWFSKKDKYGKETSKWQSMPELMLRYRAAAWFVRTYAPEIAMGIPEAEEARDTIDITPVEEAAPEQPKISQDEIKAKASRKAKPAPQPQPEPQPAREVEALPEPAPVVDVEPKPAPQGQADDPLSPGECPNEPGCHMLWSHCQSCHMNEGCPAWKA